VLPVLLFEWFALETFANLIQNIWKYYKQKMLETKYYYIAAGMAQSI
jgi:hypothetical protein